MAFTAAIGTKLFIEDTPGSGTFTVAVSQVQGITGPGMKGDKIDTTTHDAANGGYKTYITGLKEGGTIKFGLLHDPSLTGHARILANFNAGVPENWQLVPPFPGAQKWSFAGVVLDLSHKYELNGATMQEVTIDISGQSVLA